MKKNKLTLISSIILIFIVSSFLLNTNSNLIAPSSNEKTNSEPYLSVIVGNYTVPGISGPISINEVLKIGILCDMNEISGEHAWNGALLAAKEINEAGGVLINFTTYYVGLVTEDTEEMSPYLDITIGVQAANRMVNIHNPHFVIGGIRSEALYAYQEVIMDAHLPFICIGASDDGFCQNVLDLYARYKYFFRVMPLNSTSLANELITYTLSLVDYLNSTYGSPTFNIGILREDLSWNYQISNKLETILPLLNPNINIVNNIAFPITATATDMITYLTTLESGGAQIVIPLISTLLGILMSQQYAAYKPRYLLAGINTHSQVGTYWEQTAGSCRYEIMMDTIHDTLITPLTIPFWNNYIMEYNKEPQYMGVGSYNAVKLLANATIETQSFNSDTIVTQLEKINTTNPFSGVSGNIAFTPSHDLVEGWPYATALFAQWQIDGKKVVLSSGGSIYPDYLATGDLSIPYWGINNLVAGYSHLLPGNFYLTSNADAPDTDGVFNLNWTDSNGANNYSLFMSNEMITYVSEKHTALVEQSDVSSFHISGLLNGEYYFVVVAYNETGQKFSNNWYVLVQLQGNPPENFILYSNADDPDTDGTFYLIWTDSEGANSYSVYASINYITEINIGVVNLAYQSALSPFSISVYSSGDYYYIIVAHNQTGDTLSNCIKVTVLLSDDGTPTEIPGFNWVLLLGVASLISLILINKLRKLTK